MFVIVIYLFRMNRKYGNKASKVGHGEIFEIIRREILSGKFDETRKLPSESSLAMRFNVSRPTISRVTLDLKREGLIVTHRGAPTTLSRFALNATGRLGIVVPGECYAEIFKPICNRLVRLAAQSGWDIVQSEIKSSDPLIRAREARKIAYTFAKQHVSGIFFQPIEFLANNAQKNVEVIDFFESANIPVVLLDYDIVASPDRSRYDLVGIDNFTSGIAIGRHLISCGAKRIAFLLKPNAAPTVTDRMRGVAVAVIEGGGIWMPARNILKSNPTDKRKISRFIRMHQPDAFVAGNDIAAKQLIETFRAIGSNAQKIRVVGFDDVAVAAECGFTSVKQPLDDIAETALQTLLSRIKNPRMPPRTILLPTKLVVRN